MFFSKLWDWFNGKKTVIGGLLTAIAFWLTQSFPMPTPVVAQIIHYLNMIGQYLLQVGLLHKLDKGVTIIRTPVLK
jgi:uncharacterized membrane protein